MAHNRLIETRTKVLLCALPILVVGLVLLAPKGSQEPSYQGRSLSDWISIPYVTVFRDGTPVPRRNLEEVNDALRHMGTNVIPYLVRWIQYDGGLKKRAAKYMPASVYSVTPLRWFFDDPNQGRSQWAVETLANLGTSAIPVLPELKLLLNNPNRQQAIKAYVVLERLGPPAAGVLAEAAENKQNSVRDFLIPHLANLACGPERAEVMPTLTRLLQDPDPAIQARASNAINRILHTPHTPMNF